MIIFFTYQIKEIFFIINKNLVNQINFKKYIKICKNVFQIIKIKQVGQKKLASSQENIKEEKRQKKLARREKRLQRFENSRNQTLSNKACHSCYWLTRSFGQSPCKTCSRFDSSRKHDKYKNKK